MFSDLIVARRKSAKKSKRRKYPRAFWIVPVKLKARMPKHAHVLGQAGLPPCPIGTKFAGRIGVGPVSYCIYVDDNGVELYIQC